MIDVDRRTLLGSALASLAASAFLPAQEAAKPAPPRPLDAPIDVTVPVSPTAFTATGQKHLVYELHLTNFGRIDCLLSNLEVQANGRQLAAYSSDALTK